MRWIGNNNNNNPGINKNSMRVQIYRHYNVWHITPTIAMTYEKRHYTSIDVIWLKWGVSVIINDVNKV
jgi:hypothetical protein